MIEWQAAFNVAAGAFCSLMGWLLRALWQEVKELKSHHERLNDRVNSVEILVAGKYQLREDSQRDVDRIMVKLDRIEQRMDQRIISTNT